MINSTETTTAPVSVFIDNTTQLKENNVLNNFTTPNFTVTLPNTTVVNTTSDGESGSFFILLDHLSVQVSAHFMQQNGTIGRKTVSQFICYAACFNQRTLHLVIFFPFWPTESPTPPPSEHPQTNNYTTDFPLKTVSQSSTNNMIKSTTTSKTTSKRNNTVQSIMITDCAFHHKN